MERMTVCFGHRTAFQVLRALDAGCFSQGRGKAGRLPDRAPSIDDLEGQIARIESVHPGLSIDRPVHILLGSASRCRATSHRVPHVCTAQLRGRAILQVLGGIDICSAPFACVQTALSAQSEIDLLELAYELCGTYRTKRTSAVAAYHVPPLTSARALGEFVAQNPSLGGSGKLARILPHLADGSASPRETKQALVLGLPLARGGYGLGIPRMNFEVKASGAARAISGKASFRCDMCWPEAKLDVEYQSREHHGGEASRLSDSRRTNALMTMGWTVIGVTNDELDSLAATDAIAKTVRRCLGKRVQVHIPDYHARKLRLRRQLGLGLGYD